MPAMRDMATRITITTITGMIIITAAMTTTAMRTAMASRTNTAGCPATRITAITMPDREACAIVL